MGKIRVLIASHPRLMSDLVFATISDQPDMEVVGEASRDADIVQAAEEFKPDFVVIFAEELDQRPAACTALLAHNPHEKILVLAPERNLGAFYWAEEEIRSRAVESSEQGILDVLRGQRDCSEDRTAAD